MAKHVVELKIRTVYELPDDCDRDSAVFHLEENLCVQNLLNRLYDVVADNDPCWRSQVRYLGLFECTKQLELGGIGTWEPKEEQ